MENGDERYKVVIGDRFFFELVALEDPAQHAQKEARRLECLNARRPFDWPEDLGNELDVPSEKFITYADETFVVLKDFVDRQVVEIMEVLMEFVTLARIDDELFLDGARR